MKQKPAGKAGITIVRQNADWKAAGAQLTRDVRKAARLALSHGSAASQSKALTILLTGDEQVRVLNRDYRGNDKPTNVLSFPAAQPADYLGDIALAYGVARREAEVAGKPLQHHVLHLTVHGVLHLLGYDHEDPREAEAMESLETAILAGMSVPDPYRAPVTPHA